MKKTLEESPKPPAYSGPAIMAAARRWGWRWRTRWRWTRGRCSRSRARRRTRRRCTWRRRPQQRHRRQERQRRGGTSGTGRNIPRVRRPRAAAGPDAAGLVVADAAPVRRWRPRRRGGGARAPTVPLMSAADGAKLRTFLGVWRLTRLQCDASRRRQESGHIARHPADAGRPREAEGARRRQRSRQVLSVGRPVPHARAHRKRAGDHADDPRRAHGVREHVGREQARHHLQSRSPRRISSRTGTATRSAGSRATRSSSRPAASTRARGSTTPRRSTR